MNAQGRLTTRAALLCCHQFSALKVFVMSDILPRTDFFNSLKLMNTLGIFSSMGIVFKPRHQYSTELLEGVGEGKEGAAQVSTNIYHL